MSVSVMLKPASSACNLKCKYCFYTSLAENRSDYSKGFMTDKTVENVIKSALSLAKGTPVVFTFQGGEPTLCGIDFYKSFVNRCGELNSKNSNVTYCIQTNGTLIDEDWCSFFKENNFLVGISLDGNKEQNKYRVYPNGNETFDDVLNAVNLMKKHNVKFNVLSVITKNTALSIRDNYKFLKQNGINNFQYINCLKPLTGDYNPDFYMDDNDYSFYLQKAFKLYYNDNMRNVNVSVRNFDNYLKLLSGQNAEQCGMNGFCSPQFVVEGDGTVYPCDFFCTDEYELGNINEKSLVDLSKSKKFINFIESSYVLEDKCKQCEFFAVCRGGGCRRYKMSNDFCMAYKNFFSSSIQMMKNMIGR